VEQVTGQKKKRRKKKKKKEKKKKEKSASIGISGYDQMKDEP